MRARLSGQMLHKANVSICSATVALFSVSLLFMPEQQLIPPNLVLKKNLTATRCAQWFNNHPQVLRNAQRAAIFIASRPLPRRGRGKGVLAQKLLPLCPETIQTQTSTDIFEASKNNTSQRGRIIWSDDALICHQKTLMVCTKKRS